MPELFNGSPRLTTRQTGQPPPIAPLLAKILFHHLIFESRKIGIVSPEFSPRQELRLLHLKAG